MTWQQILKEYTRKEQKLLSLSHEINKLEMEDETFDGDLIADHWKDEFEKYKNFSKSDWIVDEEFLLDYYNTLDNVNNMRKKMIKELKTLYGYIKEFVPEEAIEQCE